MPDFPFETTPIVPLASVPATVGQPSTILNGIVQQFEDAVPDWYPTVLPYATNIFMTLAAFQLIWTAIGFALSRKSAADVVGMLIIFFVSTGFFYALILHPEWILDVLNSFRIIGAKGASLKKLSPSAVVDQGLAVARGISGTLSKTNLFTQFFSAVAGVVAWAIVVAAYAIIASQLVVISIEVFFVVSLGPILLAFGGLGATRYVAMQYLAYIITAGIKLMSLYFVMGVGMDMADGWGTFLIENGSDSIDAFAQIAIGSVAFGLLTWHVPRVVSGIAMGSPQLNLGMLMGGAAAGAAAVKSGGGTAATGVYGAGMGVYGAAQLSGAMHQGYQQRRDAGYSPTRSVAGTMVSTGAAVSASVVGSFSKRYRSQSESAATRMHISNAKIRGKSASTGEDKGTMS